MPIAIIRLMIRYGFVDYFTDLLKLFGFSCSIPFGSMMHLAMLNPSEVSFVYIVFSSLSLCFGITLITLGCRIKKRYQ
jgi:hypothetical protein